MKQNELTIVSHQEMVLISGGSMNPREWLNELGDWIADGIGWLLSMEGARVGGNTANGGNAAAVVAYK